MDISGNVNIQDIYKYCVFLTYQRQQVIKQRALVLNTPCKIMKY